MRWDVEKRHQQVLGGPERLSFVSEDHLDARHHAALDQLQNHYNYDEEPMFDRFFASLAHSPEFFASYIGLGVTVSLQSGLPDRARELAILRTGWLHGAPYIWGEHVFSTRRELFSKADIQRIIEGSDADGWDERDRAVLRAAEELYADTMISDATWDVLAQHLDERQLLELPIVIGHYVTTAYVQNSLRNRLSDYCDGLDAR